MRTGYLFALPCIVFFVVTFIWPAGYGLYLTVPQVLIFGGAGL